MEADENFPALSILPPSSKYSSHHNFFKHPQLLFYGKRPNFTHVQNNRGTWDSVVVKALRC